jgi:hypothetical protein
MGRTKDSLVLKGDVLDFIRTSSKKYYIQIYPTGISGISPLSKIINTIRKTPNI